jgi:RNA 3'-terminal phosphate cyclase (ATP)
LKSIIVASLSEYFLEGYPVSAASQTLRQSPLGAGLVAERAETLGSAAGRDLVGDLAAGTALNLHAADPILVYLALAGGESSFTAQALSGHARTAMWPIEQFLLVRFESLKLDGKVLVRVVSRQRGRSRPT